MAELAPKVSVVIVNWNGAHHLPTCLDNLTSQTFRDFETILVDNGSTDGSVDLVRVLSPGASGDAGGEHWLRRWQQPRFRTGSRQRPGHPQQDLY